mmetsp:Transcript_1677/g.4233  ORF Transcript_1677/g.4233 Transcript_1677/m.4233 type:complete len:164 (+) Transcript_1677:82-573(+)
MTTRTFPIFRSVQRALVGSAGVGKHELTLAVAARQNQAEGEEPKGDGTEERSEHQPDSLARDDNGRIIFNNPNTWPINSEKARQLRRDFVQEGFRRLYNVSLGQSFVASADNVSTHIGNHVGDDIAAELRGTTNEEEGEATYDDERSQAIRTYGNEDWLFYAQ